MKRWLVAAALGAAVALAGCASPAAHSPSDDSHAAGPGYTEPDQQTRSELMPAVREYFYYRKRAVIAGDPEILWRRYPDLKQGADPRKGVNNEANLVQSYRSLRLVDGDIDLEDRGSIRVKIAGDAAEVVVHGTEMYLREEFDPSGGEFMLTLFLRKENGQWTVVKTDEVTLAELHQTHP